MRPTGAYQSVPAGLDGWLAGLGIQTVVASVTDVHRLEPLRTIGQRVIPAVADL